MAENINSLRLQIDALTELLHLKNQQADDATAIDLYRRKLFQLIVTSKLQIHHINDLEGQLEKRQQLLASN